MCKNDDQALKWGWSFHQDRKSSDWTQENGTENLEYSELVREQAEEINDLIKSVEF